MAGAEQNRTHVERHLDELFALPGIGIGPKTFADLATLSHAGESAPGPASGPNLRREGGDMKHPSSAAESYRPGVSIG